MSLDEISKAAEKEREKNNRQKKDYTPQEKIFRPVTPESWKIYSQIYPHSIDFRIFILLTLGITIFSVTYFIFKSDWMLYFVMGSGAILIPLILSHFILKIYRFSHYKKWRTTIGFPINGWDYLGTKEDFPQKYEWNKEIIVKINFKVSAQNEERKLMHDAMYLLTSKANNYFYELENYQSGYMGDIRIKWMINDKLTASGSGDANVVGEIYLSLDNHFRKIHEKYQCIESVDVKFSNSTFKAEPPTISSD